MSKSISSVRISVSPKQASPGDKIAVGLSTISPSGGDTGPDAVVAEGLCYKTSLDLVWAPDNGEAKQTRLFGTGGTPPVWVDDSHKAVASGGPNPGYSLETPEGLNCGVTRWISELGFGWMIKHFPEAGPGLLQVKGHLHLADGSTLDSVTADCRIG